MKPVINVLADLRLNVFQLELMYVHVVQNSLGLQWVKNYSQMWLVDSVISIAFF